MFLNNAMTQQSKKTNCKKFNMVLQALKNSQAIIEFSPQGIVLNANQTFCMTMGYNVQEIVHQNYRILCTDDYIGSDEYNTFWLKLEQGHFVSVLCERKKRTCSNHKYRHA